MSQIKSLFNPGHFYSPVPNNEELKSFEEKIWPNELPIINEIEFNDTEQLNFINNVIKQKIKTLPFMEEKQKSVLFKLNNGSFSGLDAVALGCMILKFKPNKIVEVGSGNSTLLINDINKILFNSAIDVTSIEPYPQDYLIKNKLKINLIQKKVQEVEIEKFEELNENDIIFVDSSHVSKTNSDVNHIFFKILPILKKGVIIHFHDIFLPHDYPKQWVLEQNRSWNEQYLLQAFLMYNSKFKVLFSSAYCFYKYEKFLKNIINNTTIGGGSFWLQTN